MPQDEDDTKSAGAVGGAEECPGSQRLTNADFRRLLMTPRGAPTPAHHSHNSHNHVAQTPQATRYFQCFYFLFIKYRTFSVSKYFVITFFAVLCLHLKLKIRES